MATGCIMIFLLVSRAENPSSPGSAPTVQTRRLSPSEVWVRPKGHTGERDSRLRELAFENRTLDLVILGNSRAFSVSQEFFHTGLKVRNVSIGGANVQEMMALWQALLSLKQHPSTLLIFIDPSTLHEEIQIPESLRPYWEAYYGLNTRPMLEKGGASKAGIANHRLESKEILGKVFELSGLFSWDGVRVALETWVQPKGSGQGASIISKKDLPPAWTAYAFDGSQILPRRDRTAHLSIQEAVNTLDEDPDAAGFESQPSHIQSLALLRDWLRRIAVQRERVVLVLPSYAPAVYRKLEDRHREALMQFAAAVNRIAVENGVTFCNAMDPALSNCSSDDFRDDVHAEPVCVRRFVQRCFRQGGENALLDDSGG